MLLRGDDSESLASGTASAAGPGDVVRVVHRTLLRIPGRRRKIVGDIGCGDGTLVPFLAWHFRSVVAVDPERGVLDAARDRCDGLPVDFRRRDLHDLGCLRGRLDLAVAFECLGGVPRLDRVLAQLRDTLVEGGLLLATLPAAPRLGGPRPARLDGAAPAAPGGLHEFEAQYLFRRAGFPGVRLLRLRAADGDETLVVLACRRASN